MFSDLPASSAVFASVVMLSSRHPGLRLRPVRFFATEKDSRPQHSFCRNSSSFRESNVRWSSVAKPIRVLRISIWFRAEVRDFYSGSPNYNQVVRGNLQNNVVLTGGLLVS